jgi:uncharacterized damage-inducible protein DinB
MKAHFEMMARYNAWANRRLYAACAALTDEERRRDLGAFFRSLHGTLNHLLVADVIWTARFRGAPNPPWSLDHEAHADFDDLRAAREAMDKDIERICEKFTAEAVSSHFTYRNMAGTEFVQPLSQTLTHFFNHQTHHRGQCHAMLTRLAGAAPEFDLIYFLREETA